MVTLAERTWKMAFPKQVRQAKAQGIYPKILAQVDEQSGRELTDMVVKRGIPLEMAREKVIYDLIQNEETNLLLTWLQE